MGNILVFAGSNSSDSINMQVAMFSGSLLQKHTAHVIQLKDFIAPIYSIDAEKQNGIPASMHMLLKYINSASGFIFACPEHNGSMPAFFKNTIDWLSRIQKNTFSNKPMFMLTVSPGQYGGGTVHESLLSLLPRWGANLICTQKIPNYTEIKDPKDYFIQNQDVYVQLQKNIAQFEELV